MKLLNILTFGFLMMTQLVGAAEKVTPVLLVGDSHTAGPFGAQLEKRFKQQGFAITRVGCVGASNDTFIFGGTQCNRGSVKTGVKGDFVAPQFRRLLARENPEVVVFALGANMYNHLGWTPEKRQESARKLAELVSKNGVKKCFWIGPKYGPNKTFGDAGKVMSDLQLGFGGVCEPIDSRKIAEFNWCGEVGDFKPCCCDRNPHFNAVRYGKAGPHRARQWADQAFDLLMAKLLADSGQHRPRY